MKKQTKLLIALMCVLVSLFAFAMVSSAAEYTVSSADEFNTAFASAVDGDTIVIKGDITTNFDFGKSITYIIDGEYTWTINGNRGGMCTATGKTISILAKNGNATFLPNAARWWTSYQNAGNGSVNDLSSTVWNFGAVDNNSTITLDLSAASEGLFFFNSGAHLKEFNLLPGTRVCNLNGSGSESGRRHLSASTVNMYDNVEIFGNSCAHYNGLIYADVFNMYGGKVYGNVFGCYGLAQAKTVNIFAGKITNNFQIANNNNGVPGAIINGQAGSSYGITVLYDGVIENNLLLTNQPTSQSALCAAGGTAILSGAYRNNYETSNWGTAPVRENGVFVSSYDYNNATEDTMLGSYTTYDYSIIFMESNSKLISAYMVKDGSIKSTVSGATEVTIPSDITAWSLNANDCKTVEVVLNAQGTYYVSLEHTVIGEKDCTKGVICDQCETVLTEPQASHDLVITIVYENNNFVKAGTRTEVCQNSACEHNAVTEAPALFSFAGYSTNNDNTELCASYTVNVKAMEEYTTYNEGVNIQYGIIAVANPTGLDLLSVENESVVANTDKAILAPITGNYVGFDFRLSGFTNVTSKDELDIKSISLVINAYVAVNDEVYYIGSYSDLTSYNTEAEAFTFYNISKETPPTFE